MGPREAGRGIVAVLAVIVAGCAVGRRPGRAAAPAPAEPLYWSDLGPDRVDVSAYPPEQRRNYAVYAAVCSRCHTLARSVNSPAASRAYWEMYVLGMRMVSRGRGEPITAQERRAVLDFLEYDSRIRKREDAEAFRRNTDELKRRFDPLLRERMRRLQESKQPVLVAP